MSLHHPGISQQHIIDPPHSGSEHTDKLFDGTSVRVCLVPWSDADHYLPVRLTNGASFYVASGGSGSGAGGIVDQGTPNLLSEAWPVKLSDGSSVLGVAGAPLVIQTVSGSAFGILVGGQQTSLTNPLPTQTLESTLQLAYDIGETTIYAGRADRGVAQASAAWTIKRTELDVAGNPTAVKWAGPGVTWVGRTGHSYS